MPLIPDLKYFVATGKEYKAIESRFNEFIDAILSLSSQIPSLVLLRRDVAKQTFLSRP